MRHDNSKIHQTEVIKLSMKTIRQQALLSSDNKAEPSKRCLKSKNASQNNNGNEIEQINHQDKSSSVESDNHSSSINSPGKAEIDRD